jgi:hypothetical protein
MLLALASSVVLLVIAALLVGPRLLAPGTGPGAIGSFGIATTTSNCPAASVPGANARCPQSPECWTGILDSEGVITTNAEPCAGAHSWQTFAIGIMPASASGFNVNLVQVNSVVRAVCSYAVMLSSREGQARQIPRSQWQIQVVPPDEAAYDSGVRTYRCLASRGLDALTTSAFGK